MYRAMLVFAMFVWVNSLVPALGKQKLNSAVEKNPEVIQSTLNGLGKSETK